MIRLHSIMACFKHVMLYNAYTSVGHPIKIEISIPIYNRRDCSDDSSRVATMMIYLTDVRLGGATVFPAFDLAVSCEQLFS